MERGTVLFVNGYAGCEVYLDLLRDREHTTLHATRPEDALGLLTSHNPDVVVTDIAFAHSAIDGPAFVRDVRARVDDATSIIVLSRYVRAADREDARAAGADLFLMTPTVPAAVLFEVHRALILRRGGRRLPWNWPRRPASVAGLPFGERRSPAHSSLSTTPDKEMEGPVRNRPTRSDRHRRA
jgi:CheY-like chemotaxis protein